jgi:hypothetical protein
MRDGGAPAGNCPSSASPVVVTTCTDSGVEIGTHSYVVTAKWRSWSAAGSAAAAKITVGPVTHLDLKAVSATPVAGATNNLTITAQDANDATVTTYTGSRNLTFSGASASPNATVPTVVNSAGSAIAFGSATAINFSAGVATVSSSKNGVMRLYRSGATSVAVSDGTLASVTPLAVTVNTASASKLAFANLSISAGSLGSTCLFTCSVTALGNSGTIKANVLVADTFGNDQLDRQRQSGENHLHRRHDQRHPAGHQQLRPCRNGVPVHLHGTGERQLLQHHHRRYLRRHHLHERNVDGKQIAARPGLRSFLSGRRLADSQICQWNVPWPDSHPRASGAPLHRCEEPWCLDSCG